MYIIIMSNFYTTVCVAWDGDPPTPPPRAIGLFPCCFCHRDNLGKVFCFLHSHTHPTDIPPPLHGDTPRHDHGETPRPWYPQRSINVTQWHPSTFYIHYWKLVLETSPAVAGEWWQCDTVAGDAIFTPAPPYQCDTLRMYERGRVAPHHPTTIAP